MTGRELAALAAIQRFPANRRLPVVLESRVAWWIAGDINLHSSGPNSAGESKGHGDPDAHADAVIRALESRCAALGVDRSVLSAAALEVAGIAGLRAAEQRRAGHLDEARHAALGLSAFAKTLVRRDPNEAVFHLVLSAAFVQESKNAWQINDHATIEDALRKALGEALTASRLDPLKRTPRGRHSPGQVGRSRLRAHRHRGEPATRELRVHRRL